MNSASQNFPHHLDVLRERMLHPTDYELAINYFLEEFAGDETFVRDSDREPMPHLVAVLGKVVAKSLGREATLEGALVSYLRAHRFVHGNAQADGRIVLFFYFEDADTGVVMIIPGIRRRHGPLPSHRRIDRPAKELNPTGVDSPPRFNFQRATKKNLAKRPGNRQKRSSRPNKN